MYTPPCLVVDRMQSIMVEVGRVQYFASEGEMKCEAIAASPLHHLFTFMC